MKKFEKITIVASWLLIIFFILFSILIRIDTGNKNLIPTGEEIVVITWIIIFISLDIILVSGPNRKIGFKRAQEIISYILYTKK